ncbi:MAG: hypothetical protein IJ656_03140 [Bacilli bacterium]|nr:hypothetical protein [Bacilli bacterium]MBR1582007.1 hypothetical protein [Bacilli bacterium]
MNKTIELIIDNTIVDVNWLDNDSVTALTNLAKDGIISFDKVFFEKHQTK